ncbi:STAS domain-containing protein [Rheinheimera sediminis]|uniref:STAS domain-containing protein n=1 Tax=Rheinheimera sp. YQF-1 TaxID=2499626 RepID=UPI000FDAFEE2|nr:STAS domain-containing protein [Rheinheimera sp. YQF-1]RVT48281.1 STAS domain-containing protein [Rheinheimera sp. YQF-1]
MLKISQQQQTLLFSGALDRDTVPTQWPFKLLKNLKGTVVFDFSQLALVDTAGLAWLLHQIAQAKKLGLAIQMYHVPEQLISLARLSDVLALLPLVEEDKGDAV